MTSLLALDPGGTTGWSLWWYDATTPLQLIEHGQVLNGVVGFVLWSKHFRLSTPVDELVAESFVDDGRTASPDITPLKIEGAIEALWTSEGVPTYMQRNAMKAHAPNSLLKESGYWFVGMPHATDSARHAIALQKTRRHLPTIRTLWPRRNGMVALPIAA